MKSRGGQIFSFLQFSYLCGGMKPVRGNLTERSKEQAVKLLKEQGADKC